ncbi:MAG: hypothetical protein JW871_00735 [Endomicrobiales bacterium]|nr:hypothetical protein [Endomicrobiales bacterium]
MTSLKNGGSGKQTIGNNVHEEARVYEDEINLMDCFLVLWRRKWFIFFASVLPALVIGLNIFFSPRSYTLTFIYNQELGEKDIRMLEGMFYSEENTEKLARKLQTAGFEDCAQKLANAQSNGDLKKIVSFEVTPSFLLTKLAQARSFEETQQLKQAKGSLLSVHITLNCEKNIRKIALIFRENIEKVIPLYSEKEYLNQNIVEFKDKMAAIEETRYPLKLQLERKKSTLEKLNKLNSDESNKLLSDNLILQFSDVDGSSAYLPLPYQIQAAETQIINAEEQVRADNEIYDYYAGLLKLNEKLFGGVNKAIVSGSTLGQFCSFLVDTPSEYKDGVQIMDYMKAYIKRMENKVANNMPIMEKPKIYPVAKGTVKKTAKVFAAALVIAVFISFMLEVIKKSRPQTS